MNAPTVNLSHLRVRIPEIIVEELALLPSSTCSRFITAVRLANKAIRTSALPETTTNLFVICDGINLAIEFDKLNECFSVKSFNDEYDGDDPTSPSPMISIRTDTELLLEAFGIDAELYFDSVRVEETVVLSADALALARGHCESARPIVYSGVTSPFARRGAASAAKAMQDVTDSTSEEALLARPKSDVLPPRQLGLAPPFSLEGREPGAQRPQTGSTRQIP